MDILGPFPISSLGNRYLLVVTDCFTKWVEAFPLSNMRTKTIAEVFVREIVCRYGVPLEVHTDQGRNFDSNLIKELTQLLGIRKTRATPLHPQSNGQVERQNRTILEYLSKYITDNQKDWDRWVSLYLLAYRSSIHTTTGVTPAEMYTGTDLRLPLDLIRGCPPEEEDCPNYGSYVQKLKTNINKIHQSARKNIFLSSKHAKTTYDRTSRHADFQEQQKV
jgi:transposase InsO family protein